MSPKLLLRTEGAALLTAAVVAYAALHAPWGWFFVLLLAPDLFMLGYLVNVQLGAALYNIAHTEALPLLLILGLWAAHQIGWLWLPLIWLAHIGMDRMVGYGLKYPTTFQDTHLQRV